MSHMSRVSVVADFSVVAYGNAVLACDVSMDYDSASELPIGPAVGSFGE
jgi:hypothetical protein